MTSEYILSELNRTKGIDKRCLIYALGSINDDNSEKYYSKLLEKCDRNLHYLCHCRCRCVSDFAADELEKVINKLIGFNTIILPKEMNDILWTVLNLSAFKNSDRFFDVLETIGVYYDKLKYYSLDMYYLIFSKRIKPFLSKRAGKWSSYECENNFIYALNDMLVCSITRLGEEFSKKIISLGEEYPECYGRAAFFAEFVKDNYAAYEKYASSENYDIILSSMNGVDCSRTGDYYMYSPYWFLDNSNRLYHSRIFIGKLDIRWIKYLLRLSENTKAVCSYYLTTYGYEALAYKRMSRMMLNIFDNSDNEQKELFKAYFENKAVLYANEADIKGLEMCNEFDRYSFIVKILKNISSGKSNKHVLYRAIEQMKISKQEKRKLIDNIEKYIDNHYINDEKVMSAFFSLFMQYS